MRKICSDNRDHLSQKLMPFSSASAPLDAAVTEETARAIATKRDRPNKKMRAARKAGPMIAPDLHCVC
jgi:hypothetical protein